MSISTKHIEKEHVLVYIFIGNKHYVLEDLCQCSHPSNILAENKHKNAGGSSDAFRWLCQCNKSWPILKLKKKNGKMSVNKIKLIHPA